MKKKKYIEVKDMLSLNIDIVPDLENDLQGERKLVKDWYTVTTSGGKDILWEVNEKDETFYTVSTGELRRIKVSARISVPQYKHYRLTEAGLQYCKEQIMMASF